MSSIKLLFCYFIVANATNINCPSECFSWFTGVCLNDNGTTFILRDCVDGCVGNECKWDGLYCVKNTIIPKWCPKPDYVVKGMDVYPQLFNDQDNKAKFNTETLKEYSNASRECESVLKRYACAAAYLCDQAEECVHLCEHSCLKFFRNCKRTCYNDYFKDIEYKDSNSKDGSSYNPNMGTVAVIIVLSMVISFIIVALGVIVYKRVQRYTNHQELTEIVHYY